MPPSYYRLLYRLGGQNAFLIWFSNDRDGVVVHDGYLLSFSSESSLHAFATRYGLQLIDEVPILHDLDSVQRWVSCPRRDTIDCAAALAAWNLFGDLTRSLPSAGAGFLELERAHDSVYEKLFFGNNIPAVTPKGKHYDPTWSDGEVAALAAILDLGLRLFRRVRQEVST